MISLLLLTFTFITVAQEDPVARHLTVALDHCGVPNVAALAHARLHAEAAPLPRLNATDTLAARLPPSLLMLAHMHKAGGSSLCASAKAAGVATEGGPESNCRAVDADFWDEAAPTARYWLTVGARVHGSWLRGLLTRNLTFVANEVGLPRAPLTPCQGVTYLAVVREPMARLASLYRHFSVLFGTGRWGNTFADFLRLDTPEMRVHNENAAVRFFSGACVPTEPCPPHALSLAKHRLLNVIGIENVIRMDEEDPSVFVLDAYDTLTRLGYDEFARQVVDGASGAGTRQRRLSQQELTDRAGGADAFSAALARNDLDVQLYQYLVDAKRNGWLFYDPTR